MATQELDLRPRVPLLDPAPVYWYSLLLRLAAARNDAWNSTALFFGGANQYYRSTLLSAQVPSLYVGVFRGWTVVVIGGTDPVYDQWTQNILGTYQVNVFPIPGRVHAGFAGIAGVLVVNLQAILGGSLPAANVVILGHSLGGACANIAAWLLHNANPGCVHLVYTEGAPRAGDLEFVSAAPWPVLRMENVGDPIPEVPPTTGSEMGAVIAGMQWGPCDHYLASGYGVGLADNGAASFLTGSSVFEVGNGLLAGLLEHGAVAAALPHTSDNYALRIRRWIGESWPPANSRGIDMEAVDGYQGFISEEQGFRWAV